MGTLPQVQKQDLKGGAIFDNGHDLYGDYGQDLPYDDGADE